MCVLPGIGVGEGVNFSVSGVVNNAGHYLFKASIDADDLLGVSRIQLVFLVSILMMVECKSMA